MATYHLLLLLVLVYSTQFICTTAANGFSVELIHRDSPLSPFYNKSATPSERIQEATRRSFNRVKYLSQESSGNDVSPPLVGTAGEYYMKFYIGTPPYYILATMDTASDLTWTQCKPCIECSEQENGYFDPDNSITYEKVSCTTMADCRIHDYCPGSWSDCLEDQSWCDQNDHCRFQIKYADGSHSRGELALETFTFNSTTRTIIMFSGIKFGCSHHNDALNTNMHSGIAGLGGGPSSMISQLGSMLDANQFSYCLVPFDGSSSISLSKLNFGSHADVTGEGVVSTPITTKHFTTFYFLTLEGISIGNYSMQLVSNEAGNIIIDSATTLTHLPSNVYEKLRSKIVDAIDDIPVEHEIEHYDLCYEDVQEYELPDITFRFTGGDIILQPFNTFVPNVMYGEVNCVA